MRNAFRNHEVVRTQNLVGIGFQILSVQHIIPILSKAANVDANAAPLPANLTGVVKTLMCNFEQQSLLRVQAFKLSARHRKGRGVQGPQVNAFVKKVAVLGSGGARLLHGRVVGLGTPPGQRYLAASISSVDEKRPQAVGGRDIPREAAGHAADSDRCEGRALGVLGGGMNGAGTGRHARGRWPRTENSHAATWVINAIHLPGRSLGTEVPEVQVQMVGSIEDVYTRELVVEGVGDKLVLFCLSKL